MNSDNEPKSASNPLRAEAADWFAAMRGPDGEARRAEFDAWIARDASHRAAYNRIADTFSMGKGLKPSALGSATNEPISRRGQRAGPKLLIPLAALVLAGIWALSRPPSHSAERAIATTPSARPSLHLATRVGEIRTMQLADGSSVTLDTDSVLDVGFGPRQRALVLERGRARFTVAHEARPFIVRAGGAAVIARGTIFDVGYILGSDVRVRLLRGAIDVSSSADPGRARSGLKTTRLAAGEGLDIGQSTSPRTADGPNDDLHWPEAVRDFDRIRLVDLLREANRYRMTPIVLASPNVGDLRVSGTFRLQDAQHLPDDLADILGLTVSRTTGSVTLSKPCLDDARKHCLPSS